MERHDQGVDRQQDIEEVTCPRKRPLVMADPPDGPDGLDNTGNPYTKEEECTVFRACYSKRNRDEACKKRNPLEGIPVVELAEAGADEGKGSCNERVPDRDHV